MSTKAGAKYDAGKLRYDLVPPDGFAGYVHVLTVGAWKYTDRNWEQGIAYGRLFAAMQRHAWAWWGGEEYDRECPNAKCGAVLPPPAGADPTIPCPHCGCTVQRQHHLDSVTWGAISLRTYVARKMRRFDDRPRPRRARRGRA